MSYVRYYSLFYDASKLVVNRDDWPTAFVNRPMISSFFFFFFFSFFSLLAYNKYKLKFGLFCGIIHNQDFYIIRSDPKSGLYELPGHIYIVHESSQFLEPVSKRVLKCWLLGRNRYKLLAHIYMQTQHGPDHEITSTVISRRRYHCQKTIYTKSWCTFWYIRLHVGIILCLG